MDFQSWLTPSGLAALAGAVAWLIRAVVSQDRRVERLRESGEKLAASLAQYQSRETCASRHSDVATRASLSEAFEQLRALERAQAEDRAAVKVALERFSAAVDRLDRIEERLSRYFEDSSPRIKRGG